MVAIFEKFVLETLQQYSERQVQYTTIVLDDASHKKLAQLAPRGWRVLSHHLTIISPPQQKGKSKIDKDLLGQWVSFDATGFASNDKVATVIADIDLKQIELKGPKFPHVTIAISDNTGGKPVMSNNFEPSDFTPIERIHLCGKIEEVTN